MVKDVVDDKGAPVTLYSAWFEERAERNMLHKAGVGAQAELTRIIFTDGRHSPPLVANLNLSDAKPSPMSETVDARTLRDTEEMAKSLEIELGSFISKYDSLLKEMEAERTGRLQDLKKNEKLAKRVSVVLEGKRPCQAEYRQIQGLTAVFV